eukprot:3747368-Amphidinium_carterae.1
MVSPFQTIPMPLIFMGLQGTTELRSYDLVRRRGGCPVRIADDEFKVLLDATRNDRKVVYY